jgi:hypothetical protein
LHNGADIFEAPPVPPAPAPEASLEHPRPHVTSKPNSFEQLSTTGSHQPVASHLPVDGITVQSIINKYSSETGLTVDDVVAKYAGQAASIKASDKKPIRGITSMKAFM